MLLTPLTHHQLFCKDPVVSPHGVRFEAATIRLWLSSRGSVCPITQKTLRLLLLTFFGVAVDQHEWMNE
jgi:hypothetical protein